MHVLHRSSLRHRIYRGVAVTATLAFASATFTAPAAGATGKPVGKQDRSEQRAAAKKDRKAAKRKGHGGKRHGQPVRGFPYSRRLPAPIPVVDEPVVDEPVDTLTDSVF